MEMGSLQNGGALQLETTKSSYWLIGTFVILVFTSALCSKKYGSISRTIDFKYFQIFSMKEIFPEILQINFF